MPTTKSFLARAAANTPLSKEALNKFKTDCATAREASEAKLLVQAAKIIKQILDKECKEILEYVSSGELDPKIGLKQIKGMSASYNTRPTGRAVGAVSILLGRME